MQQIATLRATARQKRHRALILLDTHSAQGLDTFAANHGIPFIGATHASDRADRITEVLGSEFDVLIHETQEKLDAGLLAALSGTLKAGGLLILVLPFSLDNDDSCLQASPFSQRFARLLRDMQRRFPDTFSWLALETSLGPGCGAQDALFESCRKLALAQTDSINSPPLPASHSFALQDTAVVEQNALLDRACRYLDSHSQGCMTIIGRRGRGKSALLGRIADWLDQQGTSYAVTAARQSALSSLHRHGPTGNRFLAATDAHRSGCQVLLVDEAGSLPITLLKRYLECHDHVIYGTTVEGYENAGRAFAIRFQQAVLQHHPHALALEPVAPWRWNAGDPLEYLIDTLLLNGAGESVLTRQTSAGNRHILEPQTSRADACNPSAPAEEKQVRFLDRGALARDEPLLHQVYGLLRDTHYQTTAADLAHLLDAPNLQVWVLEASGFIKAALLLVLEGELDDSVHAAVVNKQRRLPHQLLPQLLAQSANQTQALKERYGRVIRISVDKQERRQGLGSRLLQAVEHAITIPQGSVAAMGASFASDQVSLAFWESNGYSRFHTGFKPNPRTGKPAVAVLKSCSASIDAVARRAIAIHDDNQQWQHNRGVSLKPTRYDDAELLRRFVNGQRSLHDTYAAVCRLAMDHPIPLDRPCNASRRHYESAVRDAVGSALK